MNKLFPEHWNVFTLENPDDDQVKEFIIQQGFPALTGKAVGEVGAVLSLIQEGDPLIQFSFKTTHTDVLSQGDAAHKDGRQMLAAQVAYKHTLCPKSHATDGLKKQAARDAEKRIGKLNLPASHKIPAGIMSRMRKS